MAAEIFDGFVEDAPRIAGRLITARAPNTEAKAPDETPASLDIDFGSVDRATNMHCHQPFDVQ